MSYFSVPDIIEIAELSEPFAVIDNLKGKLFSQRINPKLPVLIYLELSAVKWAYNQTPSYSDIQFTANYLYDLCGIYALKARNALNPGGIPVTPVTPAVTEDCTGIVIITAADFEPDGKTVSRPDWNGKNLTIFWNNIAVYIFPPDWITIFGGGFKIVNPTDFNVFTNNPDAVFVVMIGCFNPGAVINPYLLPINTEITVTGVDTYDLTWTTYLSTAYGKGSFQVLQYDGTQWNATGIIGIPDNIDTPTKYTFSALGNLDTRIIIS